ncbi:MAG: ShlB/FhaC/HecB family hemolysin secretion/activation protein [Leptothrix sp. (in: b-proteobacteria)]
MKRQSSAQYTLRPLAAALLALPLGALAADPVVPGAGTILQQIQPASPPASASTGTGLSIEQQGGSQLPASAPFLVKNLQITGNISFDTTTLHTLVADVEGQTLSLIQLVDLAGRITDYYHSHGYPLARAIIPAQTIREGGVTIEVIEARYGKIKLENQSRVHDPLLESTLSPLQGGQVVAKAELDHSLLLLSDIPGVVVNATVRPGEAVGTSDLVVETTPGPAVSGYAALDNYGSRYTGRARLGGTVNITNPLHHGDELTLSALSSGGELYYGRLAYDVLLNGRGTRVGGAYSALHYKLGDSLADLAAHGTAQVESLWAKHPLVRSLSVNVYGQIQVDHQSLRDHIDSASIQTDRHLDFGTVNLAGDVRDTLLAGGVNAWNLGWTTGRVGFDDSAAQSADASSAKTEGSFSRWNASVNRLQTLSPNSALYLTVSGQWANGNLDSSQKMIAGGPYTVRAYDMGAVSGDTGTFGSAEFRHALGMPWPGRWETIAFIDSAHMTVNKNPWATGSNSASLSGAGFGLNWSGQDHWSARAYVATRVGSKPDLVQSTLATRGWIEIDRQF